MKATKALTIVLAAFLAMAVGPGSNPAVAGGAEQVSKAITTQGSSTIRHEEALKLADYSEDIRANYQAILGYVLETNADYVSQARRGSPTLEDAIKKHGLERVVSVGNEAHRTCLALALERISQEMAEGEFDKKTRAIAKEYYGEMQKVNVSAPIDFTKEAVIQASQQKVIIDALLYERLLKSDLGEDARGGYGELLESAFSAKEYSEHVSKRLSAIDGIYDALIKSRVGFRGLFASGGINKSRNFRKQFCKSQAEKVFASRRGGNPLAGEAKKSSPAVTLATVVPNKQAK